MKRRFVAAAWAALLSPLLAMLLAGHLLTQAANRPVGVPPADLHAAPVTIALAQGRVVRGWLVSGKPGGGAVLLLHGVRSDRRQMLERARFLHRAGFTCLLIDLPAHGESSGGRISFGAVEGEGVRAALQYLRGAFPRERIGVIGVSLGAASLVLSRPQPAPNAVVLESMYPDIADATRDRISIRLGPSAGKWLAPLLLKQVPLWLHRPVSELRPLGAMGDLHSPLLIASGSIDRHTPVAETRRIYAAANSPKQLWVVPDAAHVDLAHFAAKEYQQRILAFLGHHLRQDSMPR
jgi:alpha-beta hydrolase superfamily lysophospholipase